MVTIKLEMMPKDNNKNSKEQYMGNKKPGSFMGNFKERHDIDNLDAGEFFDNFKSFLGCALNVGMDFTPLVLPKMAFFNTASKFADIFDKIRGQSNNRGWSWSDIKNEDIRLFKETFSQFCDDMKTVLQYPKGALQDIGSAGMSFFNQVFEQVKQCCRQISDKVGHLISGQSKQDLEDTSTLAVETQEQVVKVAKENDFQIELSTSKNSNRM